jgi:1-deoxy-D-xylulose-5-phosphate synthase
MPQWKTPLEEIKIGTGRKVQDGKNIAVLSIGPLGNYIKEASQILQKQGISVAHYDMRFVKPLDEGMLHEIFSQFDRVITLEDGCLQGGFGSAVLEFMVDHAYYSRLKRLGIPDGIVEHGEPSDLHKECGIDTDGIVKSILELMSIQSAHVLN